MAAKRGGKLNKSEVVQVRFDPILKMAAELAAAKERRTLSSFTEMAVEDAVKKTYVAQDKEGNLVNAWGAATQCWRSEPHWRLYNIATVYPELLTFEDRKIWDTLLALRGFEKHLCGGGAHDGVWMAFLGSIWNSVLECASGEIDMQELMRRYREIRARNVERSNIAVFQALRSMVQGAISPDEFKLYLEKHPDQANELLDTLGHQP